MKWKPLLIIIAIISISILQTQTSAQTYNYEYVNVTTTANITNAGPEILEVRLEDSITLNAGTYKTITCNSTIRDWNGWDDIISVNATLYHNTSSHESIDDGNTHYTNTSCAEISNDGEFLAYYTCSFEVIHYANNGEWTCNVTAEDTFAFTYSLANTTTINELYALNVTSIIDYGDLSVTDTSTEANATITNFGNVDINVTVLGYGATEGDGYGLICEQGSHIEVQNQRFSTISNVWDDKTPLSSTAQDLSITLEQPTDLNPIITRMTFWQLYVPPNPFGECTGTIRFTATTT
jgi:hypothetical protein